MTSKSKEINKNKSINDDKLAMDDVLQRMLAMPPKPEPKKDKKKAS